MKKGRTKTYVITAVIVVVGGFFFWYFGAPTPVAYHFIAVKKGTIIEEVSVTGKVRAAQDVSLAFEKSGRVARTYVRVGDRVKAGQSLVELESADTRADLAQTQAALESARAKLDELKRGTRTEDLRLAETKAANAQKALDDAAINLDNVTAKASTDLEGDYGDALVAVGKSVNIATNSLFVFTDIQFAHYSAYDQTSTAIADAKAAAVSALLGGVGMGRATNDAIGSLSGGAKGLLVKAQQEATHANIDAALAAGKSALAKVKTALEAIPGTSLLTSTESTNLNTERNNMNTELVALTGKQDAIASQKAQNQSNISTAEASVTSAQNALASAQDELALKEAGTAAETIAAQEAAVREAEARVQGAEAQLAKTVVRSPLAGIVTKQDAKVGEIVSANAPLVSVISDAKFEIEAFVPEADVAKVKRDDRASVTLDAYGDDVIFEAIVVAVDPAETMIEGVATYKTTFVFSKDDARIKSGMTANIDVLTDKRENVLAVPQRSVGVKNGTSFILVKEQGDVPVERRVVIGLRGSDGMVEVREGIKEGDQIADSSQMLTP